MPIGGADHKKVIESASSSDADDDMNEGVDEHANTNEEWESELMLKDKKNGQCQKGLNTSLMQMSLALLI